jgi:ribosomal protein S18 acetylase RimI-like enzyme
MLGRHPINIAAAHRLSIDLERGCALRIATYEPRNFDGVEALWEEVFPNDPPWNAASIAIPEKLKQQPDLIVVALDDETVVGSILAGYDGHRGWLYALAVLGGYRGRDIGTELVAEAERRLQALGCQKVNLQVRATNAGVIKFYERLGYAVEDRVSMGKRTNPPS